LTPPSRVAGVRGRWVDLPTGMRLSLRECGEPGQPLVLMLHGFPQAAFVWDALLAAVAAQGLHAVAPDLRGYGRSSAPLEVEAYRAKHLVADVVGLVQALQPHAPQRPLHALVAHDWGGAVAWNVAAQHPDALQRLVIVNAPHPATLVRELQRSPQQQAASAYMTDLAQPGTAERLGAPGFAELQGFLSAFATQAGLGWLTPELLADHHAVWQLGLHGPCAYYAASPLRPDQAHAVQLPPDFGRVPMPTTVIWGEADGALLPGLLDGLEHWVPQLQLHRLPQASHWVLHEAPQAVQQRLLAALAAPVSL
jgi:epoxide hydrolase 4